MSAACYYDTGSMLCTQQYRGIPYEAMLMLLYRIPTSYISGRGYELIVTYQGVNEIDLNNLKSEFQVK